MRLAFSIALRFLKSGKGQTLLIALGISVGVAVQVFIGSLIQGLQASLVNTTIGSSSQITVRSESDDKTIRDWKRAVYEIKLAGPDVLSMFHRPSPAPLSSNTRTARNPFSCADSTSRNRIPSINMEKAVYDGRLPSRADEVMIGRELSQKTGIRTGDKAYVLLPAGDAVRLTVSGLFDLNVQTLNKTWLITNLETAQRVLGLDQRVTTVEMQVEKGLCSRCVGYPDLRNPLRQGSGCRQLEGFEPKPAQRIERAKRFEPHDPGVRSHRGAAGHCKRSGHLRGSAVESSSAFSRPWASGTGMRA